MQSWYEMAWPREMRYKGEVSDKAWLPQYSPAGIWSVQTDKNHPGHVTAVARLSQVDFYDNVAKMKLA